MEHKITPREALYASAKVLFYEKGYNATSVRDIVQHANSKLGLFTYYFEGKDALGVQIFDEYATRVLQDIHRIATEQEPDLYQDYLFEEVFDYRCSQYLYVIDPKTGPFLNEIMALPRFIDRVSQRKNHYAALMLERLGQESLTQNARSDSYRDVALALAEGMELFFCRKLCAGTVTAPIQDALDILFRTYYGFFFADPQRIDTVLRQTRQVLERLRFTPTGPFQVQVSYQNKGSAG